MLIQRIKCLFRKIKKYDPDKMESSKHRLEKAKLSFRSIERIINSVNRNPLYDLQLDNCKKLINQFKLSYPKQTSLLSLLEDVYKSKEIELTTI